MRFNSDLLTDPADQAKARDAFPLLAPLFEPWELHAAFTQYEVRANPAKKRSLRLGVLAVIAVATGLIAAAWEPTLEQWKDASHWVAIVAAALGVLGTLGGLGVLRGGAKHAWLANRLMTERIRQFNFQVFARQFALVARGAGQGGAAIDTVIDARRRWFNAFLLEYGGTEEGRLEDILSDDGGTRLWMLPEEVGDELAENPAARQLVDAYLILRIDHQLQYARYQLRASADFDWSSLRWRVRAFGVVTVLAIATLVLIHVATAIVLGFFPDSGAATLLSSAALRAVAMTAAIAALAVRVLEAGLATSESLRRYRDYAAALTALRNRYVQAKTIAEKVRVMEEVETESFEEMRSFLESARDALFVM